MMLNLLQLAIKIKDNNMNDTILLYKLFMINITITSLAIDSSFFKQS